MADREDILEPPVEEDRKLSLTLPPIVPFAKRRALRTYAQGTFRRALQTTGDKFVRFAEDVLGQEIDARIRRLQLHTNEEGIDPFGFDSEVGRQILAAMAFLYRRYFRVETHHIERIPAGRVILVANHSGQIPIDGMMIGTALMLDAEPPRLARSMVEKWTATLPFVSMFLTRSGQVVGAPENAKRLLEQDEMLIVYPEGIHGIAKTINRRYQLTEFGLGFMRLALETHTPIVPVAVIGAEEQYISVANIESLARLLHLPVFPIIPQLLTGIPLPLPTKYRLHFGEPILFSGDPDDEDAVIAEKVWAVKTTLQTMIHEGLKQRKSIFW